MRPLDQSSLLELTWCAACSNLDVQNSLRCGLAPGSSVDLLKDLWVIIATMRANLDLIMQFLPVFMSALLTSTIPVPTS